MFSFSIPQPPWIPNAPLKLHLLDLLLDQLIVPLFLVNGFGLLLIRKLINVVVVKVLINLPHLVVDAQSHVVLCTQSFEKHTERMSQRHRCFRVLTLLLTCEAHPSICFASLGMIKSKRELKCINPEIQKVQLLLAMIFAVDTFYQFGS